MPRNETLLRPSVVAKMNDPSLRFGDASEPPRWIVPVEKIFWSSREQILKWCRLPYPRHPKGCPNAYGKCSIWDGAKTREAVDFSKPMWIVYNEFDLSAHVAKMKDRHPKWSDVQCRNLLYWQPTSLTGLNARAEKFFEMMQPQQWGRLIYLGESDGVNLWRTAVHAGIPLEHIKDMNCCRHLVLFCFGKDA